MNDMTDPVKEELEQPEIAVDGEMGVGTVTFDEESGIQGALEIMNTYGDPATVNCSGYWYDDEPPEVNMRIGLESAVLSLSMSPKRARKVAADLRMAAVHATTGDAELQENQANGD